MKRADLEHIIRAAAEIADDPEIVVIGSQAILGSFPDAPPEVLVSMEAAGAGDGPFEASFRGVSAARPPAPSR